MPQTCRTTADLAKGEELAVITFRVKNTDGTEISMIPYDSLDTWTGQDGKTARVGTGFFSEDEASQDLGGTSSLKPGEFLKGPTVAIFPGTQPG
ncbi:hypothetical protein ACFW9D_16700 [Streptomyces sp. NPDC059524]|uniref:hypothetical protein n=1 Tax=Streptomyces sp. NPDC059524 TaxID=3346856 RepID=UPI0036853D17